MKLKDKFFKNGFIILNLFSKKDIDKFNLKIKSKLNNKIKKNSNKINNLEEFHKINFTKNESNYLFKSNDRFIKIDQNIKKKISKNKTINDILLSSWKHNNYLIKWVGSLKKKEIASNVSGFRVVKPQKFKKKQIIAGYHLDMHVGGKICYDKDALFSLWVPILGFKKNQTLPLAAKSHLEEHPITNFKKSKTISNIFKSKYTGKFKFVRSKLKPGQVIFFHPNLLHGGATNEEGKTRVSLEIRLYNKNNISYWI